MTSATGIYLVAGINGCCALGNRLAGTERPGTLLRQIGFEAAAGHAGQLVFAGNIDMRTAGSMAGLATDIHLIICLLYTSPSPRDATLSRMPSSA